MDRQSIFNQFKPGISPETRESEKNYYFIFSQTMLLVEAAKDQVAIPCFSNLEDVRLRWSEKHYMGTWDGYPCYAVGVKDKDFVLEGYTFQELRSLLMGGLSEELFLVAGRALQIINWDRTHRYCGACGVNMKLKEGQRAKLCPQCGLVSYPIISPAIIVAIIKDDQILLARNSRFPLKFYSVIAGFVESGETFEECVRREVQEEIGIKVKNIKYFASQPWPFPHTLMVGFTAEYAEGEIVIDRSELDEADWFRAECLPPIPSKGSISRSLIDWFIERNTTGSKLDAGKI